MKKIIFSFLIFSALLQQANAAITLMPLTTWAKDKDFTTLSVSDTVFVTLRCSVAYDVNRGILEEYSNLNPQGLRTRVDTYRWVSSRFAALQVKDKSSTIKDSYMKSYFAQAQDIYNAYYDAMKKNQPIPHSLMTELLATDIGVCNNMDKNIFEAYKLMKNHESK